MGPPLWLPAAELPKTDDVGGLGDPPSPPTRPEETHLLADGQPASQPTDRAAIPVIIGPDGASYRNAASPVSALPMVSWCISEVPS